MEKNLIEEIISGVSFISVFSLLQLPFERINGSPVPTIIFKDEPLYFQAFVLGLNFAFCAGVITISIRHIYPKLALLSRFVSLSSIVAAIGIFVYLAVPWLMGTVLTQAASLSAST